MNRHRYKSAPADILTCIGTVLCGSWVSEHPGPHRPLVIVGRNGSVVVSSFVVVHLLCSMMHRAHGDVHFITVSPRVCVCVESMAERPVGPLSSVSRSPRTRKKKAEFTYCMTASLIPHLPTTHTHVLFLHPSYRASTPTTHSKAGPISSSN